MYLGMILTERHAWMTSKGEGGQHFILTYHLIVQKDVRIVVSIINSHFVQFCSGMHAHMYIYN